MPRLFSRFGINLVQARNPKLLLVADPAMLPISHLQALLLGDIPLKTMFGASFRIENPELSGCHPFTISAVNVCAEQQVTLHLLPPERIVQQSDYAALPAQAWRQNPAKQANLLHMMSLWQGPDWAFLSEAREPGMSLSALMAKRGTLNPGEVTTLLRQIQAGLEQAVETGAQRVDLDPGNIQLCVGYDGPVLPRDLERLHQKRLEAWPKFVVKLRLHKTMRSLCKPRLIDLNSTEHTAANEPYEISDREHLSRAFIGIAAYLLTGEGQMREIAEFPSSTPELAASYMHECLQRVLSGSAVPAPHDFTEQLSHLLTAASAELDSVEDPLARPDPLATQEMASAGFVSDFEEDWTPADVPVETPMVHASKTLLLAPVVENMQTLDFHRPSPTRFSFPWVALAATVLLLGAVAWMILGDLPEASAVTQAAAPSSPPQKAVAAAAVAEAALKPAAIPPAQELRQSIIHKTPVFVAALSSLPPSSSPASVAEVAEPLPQPVTPPPAAPAPTTIARATPQENQPADKTVTLSMQQAPMGASAVPAQAPASSVPPAPASVAAPTAVPPTPPTEVAAMQEVTIRRAVILSPEELNQTRHPQAKVRKPTSRR